MLKLLHLLTEILAELRAIRVALNNQSVSPRTQPFMPTVVDPLPYPTPVPNAPVFAAPDRCPVCGIRLDSAMGYVCGNTQCPTGMGPITCRT